MPLVSAAAAVHILRCLPPLMLPSGVLGALVLLVAGAFGGVLALAAGTVCAPPWCPNGSFASRSAAAALIEQRQVSCGVGAVGAAASVTSNQRRRCRCCCSWH